MQKNKWWSFSLIHTYIYKITSNRKQKTSSDRTNTRQTTFRAIVTRQDNENPTIILIFFSFCFCRCFRQNCFLIFFFLLFLMLKFFNEFKFGLSSRWYNMYEISFNSITTCHITIKWTVWIRLNCFCSYTVNPGTVAFTV